MEKRHLLSVAAVGCSLLWLWGVFAFDKWGAAWWGISIWAFALVFALLFIGLAAGLNLLRIDDSTPAAVLCGLVLFVVLSLGEGIFISEPALHQPPAHSTASTSDEASHSSFFYWHESTTSSSSSSSSSSKSKGAGYLLLLLLLLVLLIGSAIVPHFWVVAVLVGVILLWCFTVKEWRRAESYPEGYS